MVALVGMLMVTSLAACGSDDPAPLPPNTVLVRGMQFSPANLTVKVGDTVTWKFDDQGVAHNVVSEVANVNDPKPLDSGNPQMRGEWSYTFTEAGTFNYTCAPHPDMRGQITVVG